MNGEDYTGENERRKDTVSVRLALLERSYFENKESQAALHKRITEIKTEMVSEISAGMDKVLFKLDKRDEQCAEHNIRTTKLESAASTVDRWLVAITSAMAAAVAWMFHTQTKVGK